MDLRRLRAGEWTAALGGAAMLVAMFLPWYDVGAVGLSGWRAFTVLDAVLALVAVSALALLVVTASQPTPAVPVAMDALVTLAGLVALVLVLFRTANLPGDASGREPGLWLGLLGSAAIVVGSALAMRDERRSEGDRHTDLTGRPAPPPAEVETIQAPRP